MAMKSEKPSCEYCWHCGDGVIPRPLPRCERCSDECDDADCTEIGCADADAAREHYRLLVGQAESALQDAGYWSGDRDTLPQAIARLSRDRRREVDRAEEADERERSAQSLLRGARSAAEQAIRERDEARDDRRAASRVEARERDRLRQRLADTRRTLDEPERTSSEPGRREGARAHYLEAPATFALQAACAVVAQAFPNAVGVFLVGSALHHGDYRDVDVRLILRDEDYVRMFGYDDHTWIDAHWLMCAAMSGWLRDRTGLPIDFQFQSMTRANADHGDKKRNAIGQLRVAVGPGP